MTSTRVISDPIVTLAVQAAAKGLQLTPENLGLRNEIFDWSATVIKSHSDPSRISVQLRIRLHGRIKKIVMVRCLVVGYAAKGIWRSIYFSIILGKNLPSYDFYSYVGAHDDIMHQGVWVVCRGCGDPGLTKLMRELDLAVRKVSCRIPKWAIDRIEPPARDEQGIFVCMPSPEEMALFVNSGERSVAITGGKISGPIRLSYTTREGGSDCGFVIEFSTDEEPTLFVSTEPTGILPEKVDVQWAINLLQTALHK